MVVIHVDLLSDGDDCSIVYHVWFNVGASEQTQCIVIMLVVQV